MFLASLILILSIALFFSYCQAICQRILRREFDQEYFQTIVNANRLEFPSVRMAIEEFDAPVDYPRVRAMLKCDYLALTYLLKNAANVSHRFSMEERMLVLYCRLLFMSLVARHLFRLGEKPAILKLTAILRYFANVVGQRVEVVRFDDLGFSGRLS